MNTRYFSILLVFLSAVFVGRFIKVIDDFPNNSSLLYLTIAIILGAIVAIILRTNKHKSL